MFKRQNLKTLGIACLALVALAGCRPEEQNRPLDFKPGVYPGGAPTSSISDAALADLRQRSLLQSGSPAGSGAGAGGGPKRGGDVRLPSPESDAARALQQRGSYQGGN